MDNESLVLDLVEWVSAEPRAYTDVMSAWRTSCPRLTIWEDTIDAGLVRVDADGTSGRTVSVTARGRDFLQLKGRA